MLFHEEKILVSKSLEKNLDDGGISNLPDGPRLHCLQAKTRFQTPSGLNVISGCLTIKGHGRSDQHLEKRHRRTMLRGLTACAIKASTVLIRQKNINRRAQICPALVYD